MLIGFSKIFKKNPTIFGKILKIYNFKRFQTVIKVRFRILNKFTPLYFISALIYIHS
jgi:hypothetical protein